MTTQERIEDIKHKLDTSSYHSHPVEFNLRADMEFLLQAFDKARNIIIDMINPDKNTSQVKEAEDHVDQVIEEAMNPSILEKKDEPKTK